MSEQTPIEQQKIRPEFQTDSAKIDWGNIMTEALEIPGQMSSTYNRFYQYSFLNQVALSMQGVDQPVATYRKWQELDRQVIKGSKAKSILRPVVFNGKDEHGDPEQKIGGFKWVRCLFMLSETEGEELPPYEPTEWSRERALASLAIREVDFRSINGNSQGYSVDQEIAINPLAVYHLKTTLHEMGHVVLSHTTPEGLTEYQQHRGLMEFQAESTAYLGMNELGAREHMDSAESRAYIASWLNGQKPEDKEIRQVFTATDKILKAGRSKHEPTG